MISIPSNHRGREGPRLHSCLYGPTAAEVLPTAIRSPHEEVSLLHGWRWCEVHRLQGLPDHQAVRRLLREHHEAVLHRCVSAASENAPHGNRASEVYGVF